jgi:hypothetical protein
MECHLSKAKSNVGGIVPQCQEETISTDMDCDKSETTSTDTSNSENSKDDPPSDEVTDCQKHACESEEVVRDASGGQHMPSVVMVSNSPSDLVSKTGRGSFVR